MSDAIWPVFEDGHNYDLCNEGAPLLRAYEDLDAIAAAAGRMPLSAFDEHGDVPAEVITQLAEEAQDIPDISGFPVVWHDPADAVATLDAILSALASPTSRVLTGRILSTWWTAWRPSARPSRWPSRARRGSTS